MRFDILTIFPAFFTGIFSHGVLERAIANGIVEIRLHDLREFTHDRHRSVDDRPFGGGAGMVMKPEPILEALDAIGATPKTLRDLGRESVILLSPQGARFSEKTARSLSALERVTLICGRYEGVDERVNDLACDREFSIGDYVLSGGELAAAVLVDAATRLIPGVLGNEASSVYESFGPSDREITEDENGPPCSIAGAGGLLDAPHYTRPPEFRGLRVPEVLIGGDHAAIRRWRRERALEKTLLNRPDLLEAAELSDEDRRFLRERKPGL